ncbi:aminotransferase class IV [Pseudoclavibacter endophyticus]|nr:aminotransferase class IV [Pseudoclavibacter endophyticus]
MTSDRDAAPTPPPESPTTVIDSFLVRDGRAVRAGAHLERFVAALTSAFGTEAPSRAAVEVVWGEGIASIPREGDWFPLFQARRMLEAEASGAIALDVSVRPAPPLRTTTRLAVAGDRRRFPLLKGADGERTASDRGTAREAGDDDALYVDAAGHVIEAANGAVIGWRHRPAQPDGPALTLVLPDTDRALPSTTVAAMLDTLGVPAGPPPAPDAGATPDAHPVPPAAVSVERFTPAEVDELWYVNALHGITPVVSVDGSSRTHDEALLRAWLDAAEGWWQPL